MQRRFEEAERLFNRALEIDQKIVGPTHPSLALGLNNLALLNFDRGAYVEAEELLRRALAIEEGAYGPDDPKLITTLENYGAVLRELRRLDDADQMYDRAKSLRAQL
jgi:tetratricopeptide (TPR) repeat protein